VKKLMRNAKRKYEKRLANGEGGNNRPFFSYIKEEYKKQNYSGTPEEEWRDGGKRRGHGGGAQQLLQLRLNKAGLIQYAESTR
jgi:hypothetical protein